MRKAHRAQPIEHCVLAVDHLTTCFGCKKAKAVTCVNATIGQSHVEYHLCAPCYRSHFWIYGMPRGPQGEQGDHGTE